MTLDQEHNEQHLENKIALARNKDKYSPALKKLVIEMVELGQSSMPTV